MKDYSNHRWERSEEKPIDTTDLLYAEVDNDPEGFGLCANLIYLTKMESIRMSVRTNHCVGDVLDPQSLVIVTFSPYKTYGVKEQRIIDKKEL